MEFNIGDKVIIKSIKTKGEITDIRYRERIPIIYYIVNYVDTQGHKKSKNVNCLRGFQVEHLELDKQYYRENRIDDILKGKVL